MDSLAKRKEEHPMQSDCQILGTEYTRQKGNN